MDDSEVLNVVFDSNYTEREVPRNTIRVSRSLDNSKRLLVQLDYDSKDGDDYMYMTFNISDLMSALGKIFEKDKIKL